MAQRTWVAESSRGAGAQLPRLLPSFLLGLPQAPIPRLPPFLRRSSHLRSRPCPCAPWPPLLRFTIADSAADVPL